MGSNPTLPEHRRLKPPTSSFSPVLIFGLGNVTELSGTTTRVRIPQEAVGFALVSLFGMVGAFVGITGFLWIFGGTTVLFLLFTAVIRGTAFAENLENVEAAPFVLVACLGYLGIQHWGAGRKTNSMALPA